MRLDRAALKSSKNARFATNGIGLVTAGTERDMWEDGADSFLFSADAWTTTGTTTLTGPVVIVGTTTNNIKYQFDTLGTTVTSGAGLWIANTTLAAAGAQQVSPSYTLEGQGWKTNATAGSQTIKIVNYMLPVQGTANPSFIWKLDASVNGAGYVNFFSIDSINGIIVPTAPLNDDALTQILVRDNSTGIVKYRNASSIVSGWLVTGTTTLTGAAVIVGTSSNTIQYKFDALGVTQINGAGLWLTNTTAAAAGAQQWSPSIVWEGQGWKTNATAASQSVKFAAYVATIQNSVTPSGNWTLASSINGSAYSAAFIVNESGQVFLGTTSPASAGAVYRLQVVGRIGIETTSGSPLMSFLVSGDGFIDTVSGLTFRTNGSTQAGYITTAQNWNVGSNATNLAKLYVLQANLSSSWVPTLRIDPGTHTSLTTLTPFISSDFRGATWTWAAGTIPSQIFNYFKAFTIAGASVIATDCYSVFIDKSATSGGAVITKNWALGLGGNLQVQGHVVGGSGTPSNSLGGGAGSGGSIGITITGTDLAGLIDLTTGNAPATNTAVITLTFNSSFSAAPYYVVYPANTNAAALSGASQVNAATSTTTAALNSGGTALAANTNYKWFYMVIG